MVNDRKPINQNFTYIQGEILGNEKGCLDISNSDSNLLFYHSEGAFSRNRNLSQLDI
jgi:hypothetical protein